MPELSPGSLVALVVLAVGSTGCSSLTPRVSGRSPRELEFLVDDYRPEVLQTVLREFTVKFTSVVEKAAEDIEDSSLDRAHERNALRWKIQAVPEGQLAGLRIEPVAAMLDMWCLCIQMDDFLRTGGGADLFGDRQRVALDASELLRAEVTAIAKAFIDPDHWSGTEEEMLAWTVEHPIESLSFARETIIVDLAEHSTRSEDVFGTLGSIEEIVLAAEKGGSVYATSLPRQARWQAELVANDMLAEASELVDDSLETMTAAITEERGAVLDAVASERAAVLAEVDRQRLDTILALREELAATRALMSAERQAALEALRTEREVILSAVTSEREATVDDVDEITHDTVDSVEESLNRLVDRALRLIAIGAAALFALVVVALFSLRGARARS